VVRVAVMGAGSWGSAVSLMSADANQDVTLWARRTDVAREITESRTNVDYLPGVTLPASVVATDDPERALAGAGIVVVAVPSTGLHDQLEVWGRAIPADATIVSLVKGVDVATRRFGSQVIVDVLGGDPDRVVALSGPNLAAECAQRLPSASVAASPDLARAALVQAALGAPYFRVYTNPDRVGVEVAGAVKNVVALAAGIVDGMGFGDNTKAAVITRGLAEMTRLGVALGGAAMTFAGLAGVGDLVATCASPRSRNRGVGERLGRGESIEDIVRSTSMVAEAVRSAPAIAEIAGEAGVDMPLTAWVTVACTSGVDPAALAVSLLARPAGSEHVDLPG